ncbi:hypothetical protein T265_12398 [Opisthorchis viverrini]|uniref:Uncharacterized protein n=1 Tax=Opisthorchis viverrini TaxID=6198 RepID=A0A074Z3U7_OPIVI|nr:hypothetical protein T265_12398 [Opisthorchis viverrini]KER18015.1 hypothetical protein T265_12398 [Opisthorchis viverrini]
MNPANVTSSTANPAVPINPLTRMKDPHAHHCHTPNSTQWDEAGQMNTTLMEICTNVLDGLV